MLLVLMCTQIHLFLHTCHYSAIWYGFTYLIYCPLPYFPDWSPFATALPSCHGWRRVRSRNITDINASRCCLTHWLTPALCLWLVWLQLASLRTINVAFWFNAFFIIRSPTLLSQSRPTLSILQHPPADHCPMLSATSQLWNQFANLWCNAKASSD